MNSPIAITMGDPAGIGPEIVVKTIAHQVPTTPIVVYGDCARLETEAEALGLSVEVVSIETPGEARAVAGQVYVLQGPALAADLPIGCVSAAAGEAAFRYVESAIADAMAGEVAAIVTAPINKESIRLAGHHYPGHTEILAEHSGTEDFSMMMASDDLNVVLVTIHQALREAIASIDEAAVLRVIRLADRTLSRGGTRARIGVAGLNPHAGENGLMGREEIDIIGPAVAAAQREGIDASGPFPPDTVFMRARQGAFDVVIAQYHDQGLIPFKYLGIDLGTNVTIGLPFVRTSVDHGTAFDLAGKGVADHASLQMALRQATDLVTESAPNVTPSAAR